MHIYSQSELVWWGSESTSRFESVSGSSVKLLCGDRAIADSLSRSPLLEYVSSSSPTTSSSSSSSSTYWCLPLRGGSVRPTEPLSSSSCSRPGSRYWKVLVPGMRMYWCPLMMVICVSALPAGTLPPARSVRGLIARKKLLPVWPAGSGGGVAGSCVSGVSTGGKAAGRRPAAVPDCSSSRSRLLMYSTAIRSVSTLLSFLWTPRAVVPASNASAISSGMRWRSAANPLLTCWTRLRSRAFRRSTADTAVRGSLERFRPGRPSPAGGPAPASCLARVAIVTAGGSTLSALT
uniref:Uncharacterized protein n=1 Tax=Anopheles coluzzii TaxID=1518534 RepID=A0A8W7PAX9_ANOCL